MSVSEINFCTNCGNPVKKSKYCTECGKKISTTVVASKEYKDDLKVDKESKTEDVAEYIQSEFERSTSILTIELVN